MRLYNNTRSCDEIDHINIKFFAKHSGSKTGMLRNNIYRGTLVFITRERCFFELNQILS